MQNDLNPKWVIEIVIGMITGGMVGKLIEVILAIFLKDAHWALFLKLWMPLCIIASLLIVLWRYQKEKDDTIG